MAATNGSMSERQKATARAGYYRNQAKILEYKREFYQRKKGSKKKPKPRPGYLADQPTVKVKIRVPIKPGPTGPVTMKDWNND